MAEPVDRVRWRFDISYDGAGFAGWAVQPGQRTVQGELETWVGRILRLDPAPLLVCAGRTDAGVHARGQVAHADLPEGLLRDGGAELLRRLGRALPADVLVRRIRPAPPGFDARFAAIWRRYVYRLADPGTDLDPLLRHQVTRVPDPLDVAVMNDAGTVLLGLKDFGTFCRRRAGATTIRTLLEVHGERLETGPLAGVVEFTVRADAFCHSMVRSLMGGLVTVGTGREGRDWLAAVTRATVRDSGAPTLPAGGLTLEEVGYPADGAMAARVLESRTHRELG